MGSKTLNKHEKVVQSLDQNKDEKKRIGILTNIAAPPAKARQF